MKPITFYTTDEALKWAKENNMYFEIYTNGDVRIEQITGFADGPIKSGYQPDLFFYKGSIIEACEVMSNELCSTESEADDE